MYFNIFLCFIYKFRTQIINFFQIGVQILKRKWNGVDPTSTKSDLDLGLGNYHDYVNSSVEITYKTSVFIFIDDWLIEILVGITPNRENID